MNGYPSLPHAGAAKVMWFIGLLVAIVGGVLFGVGVISFMTDIYRSMEAETNTTPDMDPVIRGVTIGFPTLAVGGLISFIASVISPARHAVAGPTYNIRNSQGNLNVAGGDNIVQGGQRVTINNVSHQIQLLQQEVPRLRLQVVDRRTARDALASMQAELNSEDPDYEWVAERLEQFTEVLERTGELYRAGSKVIGPLKQIAQLLSPYLTKAFYMFLAAL